MSSVHPKKSTVEQVGSPQAQVILEPVSLEGYYASKPETSAAFPCFREEECRAQSNTLR